jgi:hypothetical protein
VGIFLSNQKGDQMMKKLQYVLFILIFAGISYAQETTGDKWTNGGTGALQFSQAALKNWMAGGENALALNASLKYHVNYEYEKITWKNDLDLGYGLQIKSGESQKTDDRVDFNSSFGLEASNKWYYTGMLNFKTQMTNGYADTVKISGFMAPAYALLSVGIKYEPGDKFSFMVSPLTGKMTIVLDPLLSAAGSFGVDAGRNLRAELGGYVKVGFKTDILKNVNLDTKCEFFMNYFGQPFAVDVNWDLMLAMKINEYLSANISTQMIYDRDVNTELQFKEVFTFGLSFSI